MSPESTRFTDSRVRVVKANGELCASRWFQRPIQQHHSTTMSSGNKRKPIKFAEDPLPKGAAVMDQQWYNKGSGDDGRSNSSGFWEISDVVRKAELRARESLADREKLMLEVSEPQRLNR